MYYLCSSIVMENVGGIYRLARKIDRSNVLIKNWYSILMVFFLFKEFSVTIVREDGNLNEMILVDYATEEVKMLFLISIIIFNNRD